MRDHGATDVGSRGSGEGGGGGLRSRGHDSGGEGEGEGTRPPEPAGEDAAPREGGAAAADDYADANGAGGRRGGPFGTEETRSFDDDGEGSEPVSDVVDWKTSPLDGDDDDDDDDETDGARSEPLSDHAVEWETAPDRREDRSVASARSGWESAFTATGSDVTRGRDNTAHRGEGGRHRRSINLGVAEERRRFIDIMSGHGRIGFAYGGGGGGGGGGGPDDDDDGISYPSIRTFQPRTSADGTEGRADGDEESYEEMRRTVDEERSVVGEKADGGGKTRGACGKWRCLRNMLYLLSIGAVIYLYVTFFRRGDGGKEEERGGFGGIDVPVRIAVEYMNLCAGADLDGDSCVVRNAYAELLRPAGGGRSLVDERREERCRGAAPTDGPAALVHRAREQCLINDPLVAVSPREFDDVVDGFDKVIHNEICFWRLCMEDDPAGTLLGCGGGSREGCEENGYVTHWDPDRDSVRANVTEDAAAAAADGNPSLTRCFSSIGHSVSLADHFGGDYRPDGEYACASYCSDGVSYHVAVTGEGLERYEAAHPRSFAACGTDDCNWRDACARMRHRTRPPTRVPSGGPSSATGGRDGGIPSPVASPSAAPAAPSFVVEIVDDAADGAGVDGTISLAPPSSTVVTGPSSSPLVVSAVANNDTETIVANGTAGIVNATWSSSIVNGTNSSVVVNENASSHATASTSMPSSSSTPTPPPGSIATLTSQLAATNVSSLAPVPAFDVETTGNGSHAVDIVNATNETIGGHTKEIVVKWWD